MSLSQTLPGTCSAILVALQTKYIIILKVVKRKLLRYCVIYHTRRDLHNSTCSLSRKHDSEEEKNIEYFKILRGLRPDNSSGTRRNSEKLRWKQVQLDCTKYFFTNAVVREWNMLQPSVVHF